MKNLKRTLSYSLCTLLAICLLSCTDAGTIEQVDKGNNYNIEVFKYYYEDGAYVYVSRFKNTPNVVTTTWRETQGKRTVTKGNVTVFENDSIKVILK